MPATKTKKRKSINRAKEKKSMGMPQIRMKAKSYGITPAKMNKLDLIHAIQVAEGYRPCFGTSNGQCQYTNCCFLEDCLRIRA
jgi:hypothetical protein